MTIIDSLHDTTGFGPNALIEIAVLQLARNNLAFLECRRPPASPDSDTKERDLIRQITAGKRRGSHAELAALKSLPPGVFHRELARRAEQRRPAVQDPAATADKTHRARSAKLPTPRLEKAKPNDRELARRAKRARIRRYIEGLSQEQRDAILNHYGRINLRPKGKGKKRMRSDAPG